jgi:hypothetical protein
VLQHSKFGYQDGQGLWHWFETRELAREELAHLNIYMDFSKYPASMYTLHELTPAGEIRQGVTV